MNKPLKTLLASLAGALFSVSLGNLVVGPALMAQSPNASSAKAKLDAAAMQLRSEKGQASGYTPLNASTLVDPTYLFPSFSSAPDDTIWVKSGSTLIPLSGISTAGGGWTANNVFAGQLTTGVYGVKISTGSYALFLRGGSSNRVTIDYGQTVGGSDSGRTNLLWFIGPTGTFSLGGGTLGGNVDVGAHNLTNLGVISGGNVTFNIASSPGITMSAGNFTFAMAAGAGLVIPSTASAVNSTFALNPTSANALYARLAADNTLTGVNTFSQAPVVPDASFAIAKVTSLQTSLDALLKRDGSNAATAALNLGGFKISNMGNPTTTSDAVTLGYLQANYSTTGSSVTSLAVGGLPLSVTGATGAITISITKSDSSHAGYLSAADWTTFNNKLSTGVTVPQGGTGLTSITGIPIGTGTTAMTAVAGTASQYFRRNAADNAYEFATISPVITLAGDATGTATLTNLASGTLTLTLATVPVSKGGTGGTTKQTARVGLGIDALTTDTDGTTVTVDLSTNKMHQVTIVGNRTISFTNLVAGSRWTLWVIQGSGGSHTLTWPTMRWSGGSAPTLATTATHADIIDFWYDGVTLVGKLQVADFAP